ncbi:autotransporter [Escherichia coli O145:H28]|nr:autotransporter [Escherichia coli O145:H28]GEG35188.1 autotransporter [Escherichia coli O145:H28]GEH31154.1 autotransporter [Escherichia coli O145:H28]GEI38433.1 autotransporter [Escherichia coli O145:H28]
MTDFRGKTSIFSHPVYLFLRKFSLQDSRGGSGSVLNGFNGDATDNITLAGSNIINGRIETILIAQENKGTHTVNLNIKDGSVDALAVKDSTVNITKATVNTGTFASQNGTLIVDASSENTLDISGKASGDLRVYSAGSLDLINEQTAFISTGKVR